MGAFDENLDAYHALNTLNDIYVKQMQKRISEASQEEIGAILKEDDAHWEEQGKLYGELGEEMVKIMSKKWWQFWK